MVPRNGVTPAMFSPSCCRPAPLLCLEDEDSCQTFVCSQHGNRKKLDDARLPVTIGQDLTTNVLSYDGTTLQVDQDLADGPVLGPLQLLTADISSHSLHAASFATFCGTQPCVYANRTGNKMHTRLDANGKHCLEKLAPWILSPPSQHKWNEGGEGLAINCDQSSNTDDCMMQ